MKFIHRFAKSSFFANEKKYADRVHVKFLAASLQEHVLTISEIFIYRYSKISDRNIKFRSFSFLRENSTLIK